MKHRRAAMIGAAVASFTLIFVSSFSLASYSAGSDPLVTLGYLTDVLLPQWKKDVEADTAKMIDRRIATGVTVAELPPEDIPVDISLSYSLLEMTKGQKLYADEPLEIILRPGSGAVVRSPFEAQGIADLTNGKEYLNGMSPAINAYLLIPRGGDGRCIEIVNEKSYVLVRGEHHIG